ncbi:MAG: alpha/beta fold hydrolase [Actinocrinis sp.]
MTTTTIDEFDVDMGDGRVLHAYDTGGHSAFGQSPSRDRDGELAIFWHHGTPNIGTPPSPLFPAAERLGLRWLSYDRPAYGGSTRVIGRDAASGATYARAVADHLGIERFAVMSHSGANVYALASAALMPERVVGVICASSIAPFDAAGLDWFADMIPSGVTSLTAAAKGMAAKEAHERSDVEYDPEFTAADFAAFEDRWGWFGSVVAPAQAKGPEGLIDDDLSYVNPWGYDAAQVQAPTLFLHGDQDGILPPAHGKWLASRIPNAELRLYAGDAHISVLNHAESALEWLAEKARR